MAHDFTAGAFDPFAERLPRLLDTGERLTYEGYVAHGLGDLVDRFVTHDAGRWSLATYVFPSDPAQTARIQAIVTETDPSQTLTGLTLVNRELSRTFMPQFMKGLGIGTALVVLLVIGAFRDWRLSAYALLPTAIGLTWAAGALALAGVELDLFAVFAVVTFVGIGVDYGIHLVHRFHERGDALHATAELAPVILSAAGITLGGYGTLIWSSYPPLRSIGIVSAARYCCPRRGLRTPAARAAHECAPSRARTRGHRGAGRAMTARTAAVIPALNEAGSIGRVVEGLRRTVDRIFVVDDGSSDSTAACAQAAGAEVIVHHTNLGKGHAVRAGLARVFEGEFTHVLLLDGDMQHLPEEAAALIERAVRGGADVVLGQRRFERDRMPPSRYHANRIGSRVLSWFVGIPLDDTQCGFRVFRVDALKPLRLNATKYEIETEMLIKVRRRGGRVETVPVTAVYAGQHSKLRPVPDTTRTCFLAVYYRFLERL